MSLIFEHLASFESFIHCRLFKHCPQTCTGVEKWISFALWTALMTENFVFLAAIKSVPVRQGTACKNEKWNYTKHNVWVFESMKQIWSFLTSKPTPNIIKYMVAHFDVRKSCYVQLFQALCLEDRFSEEHHILVQRNMYVATWEYEKKTVYF